MRLAHVATVAAWLLATPLAAQDWKGLGRLSGKVSDTEEAPLAGVTIKLDLPERGGTTVTTDKKGRWAVLGVAAGTWHIDFSRDGYVTKAISVTLPSESVRLPVIAVKLQTATPAGPSPELVRVAANADAAYKAGRWAEARAEYEKVLAQEPALTALIEQQIGFTFIQEKDFAAAMKHLRKAVAADPTNHKLRAIAAQAALEGGLLDEARELLANLDESVIDSPDIFFNMGVNFLNAGDLAAAIDYFGKAIRVDPSYVDAYYRRAVGYVGQGRNAEARADFEKVLELQAEGPMAEMSRKALEQIPRR
jgi:Flp pilus assembly protein TadD